jgi:uncharacterized protein (TIGR04255 family)
MKLPKSISPCPIKEAVAEIRFDSNVPADAVFGIVYQALKKDFSEAKPLPILNLPAEIRVASTDLAFQPYYRLTNDASVVLVGPKVISVGMGADYPGWTVHSKCIKDTLNQFNQTGIVTKVLRVGLRFISFFALDIYPNLMLKITVEDTSIDGEETLFKTVLSNKGCKSLLQIRQGVALNKKLSEKGSVIDIDSFTTAPAGEFTSLLELFLEDAHQAEKELFFRLLKPDFLKTLNRFMTMETEFYRSPTEILPTFSLVLAASLVGLHATSLASPDSISSGVIGEFLPASARYDYYETAQAIQQPAEQAEALKRFAENLLEETEDSPQEVVDVLNRHFWDLV